MTYAEPQNMSGILSMFEYSNNVTDGIFGIGILISFYMIVLGYLSLKGEDFVDSSVVAGFMTSFVGILIFLAGLINGWHLFMCFMVTILPAVWSYYRKSG